MPALRDPQYEKFAQQYVELAFSGNGNPLLEAYKSAGYVAHRYNAARLKRRPEVTRRIEELTSEAAEWANIRVTRVAVEIDRVGRANILDLIEPVKDKDGNPVAGMYTLKDLTTLPREVTAAIKTISYDSNGLPKIDMHDKNQANFTLLKHLGGLPDEAPGVQVNILNALTIEDQAAVADLIENFPGGAGAAGGEPAGERGATAPVPETV